MKNFIAGVFIILLSGCLGPGEGNGPRGVVVGNGMQPTVESNGVVYGIGQLSTAFYDATQLSYLKANETLPQNMEGSDQTKRIEINGIEQGKATVEGQVTPSGLDASLFYVIFDALNMREGFPVLTEGSIKAEMKYSVTKRLGRLVGTGIKIGTHKLDFVLDYNLYFEDSCWRGTMKGVLSIDGKEYNVDHNYDAPILYSVSVSPIKLLNGGDVILTVRAASNSPVNWLNSKMESPEGNVFGGGSGATFTKIKEGVWEYSQAHTVSKFMPSGKYQYQQISVENEAQLESLVWPTITFEVDNASKADKPVIKKITQSQHSILGGGSVTLTLLVEGKTPPNWVTGALRASNGDYIFGGGNGRTFQKVGEDLWQHSETHNFSEWHPSGNYCFERYSVRNEGNVESNVYPDFCVEINNSSIASTPEIVSAQLSQTEYKRGDAVKLKIIVRSNAPVDWLNIALTSPVSNVFGGGSGQSFEQLGVDLWATTIMYKISDYAPIGKWFFDSISVSNVGLLKSEVKGPFEFNVKK